MLRLIQIYASENEILCMLIDYNTLNKTFLSFKDTLDAIVRGEVTNFSVVNGFIKCQDGQAKSIYVKYLCNNSNRQKAIKLLTEHRPINVSGRLYYLPEFQNDKVDKAPEQIIHVVARLKNNNSLVCCDSNGKFANISERKLVNLVETQRDSQKPIKLANGRISGDNVWAIKGQFYTLWIKDKTPEAKKANSSNNKWKYLLNYTKFYDSIGANYQSTMIQSQMLSIDQINRTIISEDFDNFYKNTEYSLIMTGNNKSIVLGFMAQEANRQFDYDRYFGYYRRYDMSDYVEPQLKRIIGSSEKKIIRRIKQEIHMLSKSELWIKHYPRLMSQIKQSKNDNSKSDFLYIPQLQDFITYRIKHDKFISDKLYKIQKDVLNIIKQADPRMIVALALYIDFLTAKSRDVLDSTVLVGQAVALKAIKLQQEWQNYPEYNKYPDFMQQVSKDIEILTGFITYDNIKKFRSLQNVKTSDAWYSETTANMYGNYRFEDYATMLHRLELHKRQAQSASGRCTDSDVYYAIKRFLPKVVNDLNFKYVDNSGVTWRTAISRSGDMFSLVSDDDNMNLYKLLYVSENKSRDATMYKIADDIYLIADEVHTQQKIRREFRLILTPKRKTSSGGYVTDVVFLPLRLTNMIRLRQNLDNFDWSKLNFKLKKHTLKNKVYYEVLEDDTQYIIAPHEQNFESFEDDRYNLKEQKYSDLNLDRPLIFDYFQDKYQTCKTIRMYRRSIYSGGSGINPVPKIKNFFDEVKEDLRKLQEQLINTL